MKAAKTRFSHDTKVYNPGDGVPDEVAKSFPHLVDSKKEVKEEEETDDDKQAKRINHTIASDGKPPVAETKEGKKGSVTLSTQTADKKEKK